MFIHLQNNKRGPTQIQLSCICTSPQLLVFLLFFAVPFSFSACISFDAAGQTHLEAALAAHILYSGSGNPALRHSDIISPMPRPQLSKTFCLYRTFTNNGFCGFDSCSDFIFRIPVGRKSSGVFYLHTVIINGYAH